MSMRPRASGIGGVRPRPAMRSTSENFKPKSEWKHEEEASILSVYLPGFVKEQIKLTLVESKRLIGVQGQRPLANERWIRFNEVFSVPENCDTSKINSQFVSGVLRIIMPKIVTTTQISPKEEAKTTQKAPSPQESQKGQGDSTPKESSTTKIEKQNVEAQKPTSTGEPKPQNGQEVTPPKAISTPSTEKQKDDQSVTSEPKPQKGEKDTPPKATSTTGIQEKKNLEVVSPQKAESKPPKSQSGQDETPPKIISTTDARQQKVENSLGSESVDQKTDERKEKGATNGTHFSEKVEEKEKEKSEKSGGDYEKKALKGLAMGLNGKRQLLVNIGAAALVIVALGASIFYSSGSMKDQN